MLTGRKVSLVKRLASLIFSRLGPQRSGVECVVVLQWTSGKVTILNASVRYLSQVFPSDIRPSLSRKCREFRRGDRRGYCHGWRLRVGTARVNHRLSSAMGLDV